jgi:hypothetical protein
MARSVGDRATTAAPARSHPVVHTSLSGRAIARRSTVSGRLLNARAARLLFPVACVAAVTVLWAGSLRTIDVREITDLGLVSVLPPSLTFAAVLLTLSFCVSLQLCPRSSAVLGIHVVALIVLLYATPVIIEEVPRNHVTWRHVGIVDLIARTGAVDPTLDVYANWPGFFVLTAFLWNAAGITDFLAVAEWSPLYLNLLYLGPLLLLFRSVTKDPRVSWLAVWLFYAANWVGQDYFSPQGFSFFLYLSILALIAAYLARSPDLIGDERGDLSSHPASHRRVLFIAFAIVLIAASVPTHQLTPIQIVVSLAFVVAIMRGRLAGLLALSGVFVAAWLVYVAYPFLDSHLLPAVEDVGRVGSNVDANVGERIRGSSDHLFVVRTRLALSAGVWALAALGFVQLWRRTRARIYILFAALTLSPLTLLGLQSYGGEVLLRAYLFSLPFAAFFAASLVFPGAPSGANSRARGAAAVPSVMLSFVLSVVLLAGFVVARYGNERAETFTREEVAAVQHLYRVAEPGSVFIAGDVNVPWRAQAYEQHSYLLLADIAGWNEPNSRVTDRMIVRRVREYMADAPARSYLIITRSQKASMNLLGTGPRGSLERLEHTISRSREFKVIYSNRDARIAMLRRRDGRS